ncbi:hypothetical protein GCM10009117_26120 [Gangjinia marincola]|uniref:Uncharacterized protein n=1 Tax=Gangjinia marincola TaxID=578463 RepID=A0ABN1MKR3_9FLAO
MKRFLGILSILALYLPLQAQNDIADAAQDILFISQEYIEPGANAATMMSRGGWYISGKTLDKWQVDVAIGGNVLYVPSSQQSFTVNQSDLKFFEIETGEASVEIPTSLGGKDDLQFLGKRPILNQDIKFTAYEGVDRDFVVYPYLQAAVGVPLDTQVTLRYTPGFEIDKLTYQAYGVGIQHQVSRYFSALEEKNLYLSLLATYSRFDFDVSLSTTLDDAENFKITKSLTDADSYSFQLVASKHLEQFDLLAAVSYSTSSTTNLFEADPVILEDALNAFASDAEIDATTIQADLGFNWRIDQFTVKSEFSFGSFLNYNLGLHYTIN